MRQTVCRRPTSIAVPVSLPTATTAKSILTSESATGTGSYVISYTYDTRNRLTNWQKTGTNPGTAAFTYDVANRRLSMAFGSLTTSYLQDTLGALPVVLQEKVSNQTAPTSYMYAPGSTTPYIRVTLQARAGGIMPMPWVRFGPSLTTITSCKHTNPTQSLVAQASPLQAALPATPTTLQGSSLTRRAITLVSAATIVLQALAYSKPVLEKLRLAK